MLSEENGPGPTLTTKLCPVLMPSKFNLFIEKLRPESLGFMLEESGPGPTLTKLCPVLMPSNFKLSSREPEDPNLRWESVELPIFA